MKALETRRNAWFAGLLLGFLVAPVMASTEAVVPDGPLSPESRHENIGELVTQFIQKSHYLHVTIDDDLSSRVMDRYIESLDRNRMYLLASDIAFFEDFRYDLDDVVKSQPLDPVFDMFSVYRARVRARFEFALTQLEDEPDLLVDEDYQFDRAEMPWATTTAELDELWRRRVKNDVVNLALTDKPWEESREVLIKRYSRYLKRMDQVKNDDVFETFMNAFAHTLDPHSSYLSPRNSEEYRIQMSLSYFGIGASLQTEDDYVHIVNIIPGGPASIDGSLGPEDKIIGVAQGSEGEMVDVIGWRLDDVVDLIRGPADTVVRLHIIPAGTLPGNANKEIRLTRGQVRLEEQAAKSEIVTVPRDGRDWSIGVIDVPSFYRDYRALSNGDKNYTSTTKDVKRLIMELEEEGIDGLIIDLRDNGGGHLTEATALSGLFIDNGPVVQLRNSNGRISRLDDPDPVARVAYNGPLAVLVNRFSASASEIFAAAIQDYARGVIIGQETFGKGTVQNLYSLDQYLQPEDDRGFGQLTLTIGKYYRVTGESTQHRGVNPDINLPSPIDSEEIGESVRDSALPWDTIKTTRFRPGEPLDNTIQSLTASHSQRAKEDPNFQYLMQYIEDDRELRSHTSISLNIEARRADRAEDLERALELENERRKALSLEPVLSLEDLDEEERPDVPLDQAAGIVTDLAVMREIEAIPAQTAQIRP
ncbi:MAG: carboxy terminal-processing peptidase [Gammaproteobacteria bacterium]|nr:carboxy terminal-processing peptidase [Gammaproteobacteria bacterium]MDH3749664.1 carboxy terminal-processing peptidase [Gammaproteobacteria bacterium]MDH3804216.1 carboxy terminal-processing peptidase [Gammaproteobacteria bacterium]